MRKLNPLNLIVGLLLVTIFAILGSCTIITGETQKTASPPVSSFSTMTATTPKTETATQEARAFPSVETGIINASPHDVSIWLSQSNLSLHIIDVRTPAEFTSGHIANAVNIDYESPDFAQNIDKLDKTAYYIVYCRTGVRSAAASKIMLQSGFSHIINMTGGITEWISEGLEIVK
jgi:phage shock protein E